MFWKMLINLKCYHFIFPCSPSGRGFEWQLIQNTGDSVSSRQFQPPQSSPETFYDVSYVNSFLCVKKNLRLFLIYDTEKRLAIRIRTISDERSLAFENTIKVFFFLLVTVDSRSFSYSQTSMDEKGLPQLSLAKSLWLVWNVSLRNCSHISRGKQTVRSLLE